jgi:histidyl-tRNA synthetase
MITRVRGTQDILDLSLRTFLIKKIGDHLAVYNFKQIQTPILEPTKLFRHSLGEHTDVVTKEMYVFQTDEESESICLRPEATASTMRAFLENHVERTPWKVFSTGQMFRHERPQKGRWREFGQINIEIIGTEAIEQDAHALHMIDLFFSEALKLEDYVIKLNFLGCRDDRNVFREKLHTFLEKKQKMLCETCLIRKEKNILRIFDCKNETCKSIYQEAPLLTDNLCNTCNTEWETLQNNLKLLSVNHVYNPHLVRGLDYYNKTVFEFTSMQLGAQDAFCGGGRWNLSKELESNVDYPSFGAAIGIDRLLLLLEKIQDKLAIPQQPTLHLIIPMNEKQKDLALLLADELVRNGLCADITLDLASIGNMMKKANKMGAAHVLILGDQEQQDGTVVIKNMINGKQATVKQTDAVKYLK